MSGYQEILGGRIPIKAWTNGVEVEHQAQQQLRNVSMLPFVTHLAVMPDVHWGRGATVGSVIGTKGALVPAAVGVDIGCGMVAAQTDLRADQLPDNLKPLRIAIERAVPVGQASHTAAPIVAVKRWRGWLGQEFEWIEEKYPGLVTHRKANTRLDPVCQLGTLGGGNHFIEICLDTLDTVWIMLHSGSRGIGNRLGQHFIAVAQKRCEKEGIGLPDRELAWLPEGTPEFHDYVGAVGWAQEYAAENRRLMLEAVVNALGKVRDLPAFKLVSTAVNCHHNYVEPEVHFGERIWVTRKGAVNAWPGKLGIIPGSMGAKSFIVRGKGNPDALHSCSHGAGRRFSRGAAKRLISLDDHIKATEGIECRKDPGVLDESPAAYKDIDAVMAAQVDLVEVVATLRQVVCVKG